MSLALIHNPHHTPFWVPPQRLPQSTPVDGWHSSFHCTMRGTLAVRLTFSLCVRFPSVHILIISHLLHLNLAVLVVIIISQVCIQTVYYLFKIS